MIGYVGAVFGALLFGSALAALNPGLVFVGMICIAISVALVYAQRTNNPNFYLPYLVISVSLFLAFYGIFFNF